MSTVSITRARPTDSWRLAIALVLVSSSLPGHPTQTRTQSAFDKAREIYKTWATAQQQKQKLNEAELQKAREITAAASEDVPKLLKTGILELLNSPGAHTSAQIQQSLSAVLHAAVLDEYDVFTFALGPEPRPSYLIIFNVPYCASCSHAWIGLVGERDGRYRVLSEAEDSFDDKSLHAAALAPSEGKRDRFLVYGTNWGDAHSRLTAVIYEVDHAIIKRVWVRRDLPQGSVDATPTRISLVFLTALRPPWSQRTEQYAVLPNGIQLREAFEHPNP